MGGDDQEPDAAQGSPVLEPASMDLSNPEQPHNILRQLPQGGDDDTDGEGLGGVMLEPLAQMDPTNPMPIRVSRTLTKSKLPRRYLPPVAAPKSVPPIRMRTGIVVTTRAAVSQSPRVESLLRAMQVLHKSLFSRKS
eukprot:COSAG01_NODE_151_length_23939_cov_24.482802_3_plen_137_part_00